MREIGGIVILADLVTVNVEFIFAVHVFIKIGNTRNNERVVSLLN